jgi:hypothetical protein
VLADLANLLAQSLELLHQGIESNNVGSGHLYYTDGPSL